MQGRIVRKWRPPLIGVLGGVLGIVLILPPAGLLALRALTPDMGFRAAAILISGAVLVATTLLGLILWRILLRPVQALAQRAAAAEQGLVETTPLPHYGTRELRDLGQAVLDMAATLQAREQAVRLFADHVSHEFKSPLTAIRGAGELLDAGQSAGSEDHRLTQTILGATHRLDQLLSALSAVALAREPRHHGQTRLPDLMGDLRQRFGNLSLDLIQPADVPALPLSRTGLEIVLCHLLQNAAAHGARSVTLMQGQDATSLWLRVQDDGNGISAGNRDKIFSPFFTTRRDQGGTGMGLAITRALLEAHGASLALVPSDLGAHFRIEFYQYDN